MKDLIDRVTGIRWIAHWMRAVARFAERLGSQFAAAITYFSVLSMVPVLMAGFAVLGLVVTVVNPELLVAIKDLVTSQLGSDTDITKTVTGLIDQAANSWQTVGIIGIVSALWAGANWIGNLKSAVRAQVRDDFAAGEQKKALPLEVLINIAIMLGVLLAVLVTFASSSVATSLGGFLLDVSGLRDVPGSSLLVSVLPVVASLIANFLLFLFLYKVLPGEKVARKPWLLGSVLGAVGTVALQYLATLLIGVFSKNVAAALFGPVIVLMLYFNLFATLILMVAAWIATEDGPDAVAGTASNAEAPDAEADAEAGGSAPGVALGGRAAASASGATHYATKQWASTVAHDQQEAHEPVVRQKVAERAIRLGTGAGYVTGAATGLGLGALIAGAVAWIRRR